MANSSVERNALAAAFAHKLSNGWLLGWSNQRYQREDGTSYEGAGVPVDIERAVDVNGFAAGKDTLLETIIASLARKHGELLARHYKISVLHHATPQQACCRQCKKEDERSHEEFLSYS
ncbi:MAG: hypothetical protein ACPGWR_12980, partial [Ardenticatenaceae bacterium]